jgi:cbb3-type cytochrome oxidase cytochrome c subunit
MKGLAPLFLGIFGTFAFSWVGLTLVPNWQIGHLNPQSDEEGTDIYPQPQSGMVERGARVYAANGCIYCHSQQVRADYAADDIERNWGSRRSAPHDYIFDHPVFLGKMRMGQDLANIGARAPAEKSPSPAGGASPVAAPAAPKGAAVSSPPPPGGSPSRISSPVGSPSLSPASSAPKAPASPASPSPASQGAAVSTGAVASAKAAGPPSSTAGSPAAPQGAATSPPSSPSQAPWPVQTAGLPPMYSAAWHHVHLYSPRSINIDSNMPAYRFLYEKRRISGERSDDALELTGSDAAPEGWEIVPSYDAKCLVAYLMSLNQSHPLKGVGTAAPAAGASPAASPSPAPAGQPPK